jgi:hypothetical protein
MEKKKDRDILSIEIQYDYKDELKDLVDSEDFNQLLLDEAIITIKNALDKNRKSTRIFYVPNLECSVVLEKRNFNKVLNKAIEFYEGQEDYVKCAELVKLKEEVNESKKGNKTSN